MEIPENFKAEFTVLLNTLIFVKLIQAAHPQFLSVLQNSKVFKIFRLSWIDGTSVDISLAEAQGSPALHPFPKMRFVLMFVFWREREREREGERKREGGRETMAG